MAIRARKKGRSVHSVLHVARTARDPAPEMRAPTAPQSILSLSGMGSSSWSLAEGASETERERVGARGTLRSRTDRAADTERRAGDGRALACG